MEGKKCLAALCCCMLLVACSNGTDVSYDSENMTENDVKLKIEESNFTLWSDRVINLEKQIDLFESLSIGEVYEEGNKYPALYNESLCMVFKGEEIEITIEQTQEMFQETLPTCSGVNSILTGHQSIKMLDVTQDGNDEIVVTEIVTGTSRIQLVDIIDVKSKRVIPFDYEVEQFARLLPEITVLEEKKTKDEEWEYIILEYQVQEEKYTQKIDMQGIYTDSTEIVVGILDQDYRNCLEDGTVSVELGIGFKVPDSVSIDYVGNLKGSLVYQIDRGCFVLDEDSIVIEWVER